MNKSLGAGHRRSDLSIEVEGKVEQRWSESRLERRFREGENETVQQVRAVNSGVRHYGGRGVVWESGTLEWKEPTSKKGN